MVDRRFALLSLLACLGGAWLLYLPALQGQFVFDDIPLLVLNRCHDGLAGLALAFDFGSGHTCSLRPVRFVSYALDHAVFGPGPFGFHVTNHLLHGLVAWLAGALVARVTRQRWVGAVAGLLFLTHPIATEAVAYIAGRRDLLAALGGLGMAHVWLGFRSALKIWHFALLALLYLLALGAHEAAVAAPAVLVAYEVFLGRLDRRRVITLGGLLALGGLFTVWTLTAHNFSRTSALWGGDLLTHTTTVLHGHAHYLRQLAWPLALQADYSPAGFPIGDRVGGAVGALLVAGAVALMIGLRRRKPLISFGLAAYGLLLLPTSQIVPHHELLAEHRLYLASLVFCAFAAAAAHRLGRWGFVGPVVVVLAYIALTRVRIDDWRDEAALWTATLAVAPETGRAHANLGALRAEQGDQETARAHLLEAARLRPDLCEVHYNLGLLTQDLDAFLRAWACDPKPRWRAPIGERLRRAGRLEEATRLGL